MREENCMHRGLLTSDNKAFIQYAYKCLFCVCFLLNFANQKKYKYIYVNIIYTNVYIYICYSCIDC